MTRKKEMYSQILEGAFVETHRFNFTSPRMVSGWDWWVQGFAVCRRHNEFMVYEARGFYR